MVPQNGSKTATVFRSRKRDRLGICSKQNQFSTDRFLVSESVLENGTRISYFGAQRVATCWRATPAVRGCLLPIGRPFDMTRRAFKCPDGWERVRARFTKTLQHTSMERAGDRVPTHLLAGACKRATGAHSRSQSQPNCVLN